MQQVKKSHDSVQSRMSLRCLRGKCYYILAPISVQSCARFFLFFVRQWELLRDCAHEPALLENKVNITRIFFFQRPVYVHYQVYKCRLLITFENSSGPTKCSRENA